MINNQENKISGIILAGGRGSRLSKFTEEIPKPLIPILGKPVMEYQIEKMVDAGIKEIYVTVGYLKEKIINYFSDGTKYGCHITYIKEDSPLGSAGGFFYLKDKIRQSALVVCGDIIFNTNIEKLYNYHKEKNGLITIVTHPNSHPYDSDLVILKKQYDEFITLSDYINLGYKKEDLLSNNDKTLNALNSKFYKDIFNSKEYKDLLHKKQKNTNLVLRYERKENANDRVYYHNLVNAGMCIIESSTLSYFTKPEKKDLEKDFISHYINEGKVYSYKTCEYIKDMGTYDRLDKVEEDIKCGKLKSNKKYSAVFLDRDGTVNVYDDNELNKNNIELIENADKAIKLFNDNGYLCILVTNQPKISKNITSFESLDEIHAKLETMLGKIGAYFDEIYYCPHHQEYGREGENPELKIVCNCRKPNTGMIDRAISEYNIDLSTSYLIGDSHFDLDLGKNANIKTILVKTGLGSENIDSKNYFHLSENLYDAAEFIIDNKIN